jgi:hypothetical protein
MVDDEGAAFWGVFMDNLFKFTIVLESKIREMSWRE